MGKVAKSPPSSIFNMRKKSNEDALDERQRLIVLEVGKKRDYLRPLMLQVVRHHGFHEQVRERHNRG